MKITVVRTGGFAGLSRTWSIRVEEQDDPQQWIELVEELSWTDRPTADQQRDRYLYRIRVSRRQIVLPEQSLTGPWRELVDRVRTVAEPMPSPKSPAPATSSPGVAATPKAAAPR